ncbi:hypothetical protein PPYR_14146 [Photinus pyralis]|uniref:Uncharacterized protein n=1 Tax=Photinus pyralis TaxID=7054 RepID=A0A5N4A4I3_PHOPY|nr:UPF0488 protein CG14286-like [Photinus pyralis]XP_031356663.1 UPF0488 protein CG14286-like [Photinus pyralis]KAB0792179.1 hypothetical protein PPYR_14138 [Photinus pyralis]KAB0792187.1 hypothetical protein PPYR_14146 [Photinus pyralis]
MVNKSITKPAEAPPQLSEEAVESFEVELCWCINQLKTALRLGKLNAKQIQDHTKSLNTLMSRTAPLIKKRQVMRLSFGDYRKKMGEEEKRVSKVAQNMKLTVRKPSTKSTFVRKACGFKFNFDIGGETPEASRDEEHPQGTPHEEFRLMPTDNSFKFNFEVSN